MSNGIDKARYALMKLEYFTQNRLRDYGIEPLKADEEELKRGIDVVLNPLKSRLSPKVFEGVKRVVLGNILETRRKIEEEALEETFNPVTDVAIAATTGGLARLGRKAVEGVGRKVLSAATSSGLAAIPTSFVSGVVGDVLRESGHEKAAFLGELGTAVGVGLTVERKLAESLDNTLSRALLKSGKQVGGEVAEKVVKRPGLQLLATEIEGPTEGVKVLKWEELPDTVKTLIEGSELRSLRVAEQRLYSDRLLCGISEEEASKYLQTVEELEKLKTTPLEQSFINTEHIVRQSFVAPEEQQAAIKALRKLKESPDFELELGRKLTNESLGELVDSVARLRDRHPYVFLHEMGRWAWFNALSPEDRLSFLRTLFKDYNSPGKWLKLSSFHAQDFAKSLDSYSGDVDKWLRSPVELFGNMVLEYVVRGHLADDTFIGQVKTASRLLAKVLRHFQESGLKVHPVTEQYLKWFFRRIEPPANFEFVARAGNVERHWLFVPKEQFERTFLRKVDAREDDVVRVLGRLLEEKELSALELLSTEGAQVEIERLLDKAHREALRLYHGYESAYSWDDLLRVVERLNQLFEPSLTEKRQLRALLRRQYGSEAKLRVPYMRFDEKGIEQIEQALKQYANDLGNMILEMRVMDMDRSWLTRPSRSIDTWNKYHELLDVEQGGVGLDGGIGEAYVNEPVMARAIRLKLVPQTVALATGIEFDSEDGVPLPFAHNLRIRWNPDRYLCYGAWLSLYSTNPKGIRQMLSGALRKAYDELGKLKPEWRGYLEARAELIRKSGIVRAFHPTEGLPEDIWEFRRQQEKERLHLRRRIAKFAAQINKKFTPEEQRLIADYIEQTGRYDLKGIDGRIAEQAEEVRALMADVREMLKAAGFPEEYLNKLGDRYLMRVYKKHSRIKMRFREDLELKRLWRSIGADYLRPRGLTKKIKLGSEEFEPLAQFEIAEGKKVYSTVGAKSYFVHEDDVETVAKLKRDGLIKHEWEIEHVGKGFIRVRRDYTVEERDALGEVVEVVPRLVEFARKVSNDLALANTIKRLLNTPYVRDLGEAKDRFKALLKLKEAGEIGEDWVLVPDEEVIPGTGIKRYGELSGKAVHPDVMHVLKLATNERMWRARANALTRAWMNFLRLWKVGVTTFNPKTHVFNFIANAHLCVIDGRNPVEVLRLGARHVIGETELFKKAVDAGLIDSNILRSELDLETFLSQIEKVGKATDTKGLFKLLTTYLNLPLKAGRGIMRLYELGDELYKMGVIAQEVAKGKSVEEGLKEANRLFFDYRDIPSGVRFLRDWGIVPFATYAYKIVPVIAKAAIEQPHRLFGILLFYQLINDLSFTMSYGKEKERGKEFERRIRPAFLNYRMYGIGPMNAIRIGSSKDEGGYYARYLNVGNWLPGADILTPNGIFGNYPFGFNPLISIVYGITTGRDPRFDREFQTTWDEAKLTGDFKKWFDERMQFVQQQLLPNVPFPGLWAYDKIGNALTAEGLIPKEIADKEGWTGKNYFGGSYSLPEELLGAFGVRTYRMYPEQEFAGRLRDLKRTVEKEKRRLYGMIKDPRTSNYELEKQIEKYEGLVDAMARKAGELSDLYVKPIQ